LGRARPDQPLRNALAELVAAQSETEPAREEERSWTPGALPTELHRLADEHAREEPVATVRTFLCWLSATVAGEELDFDDTDRVDLSTFHKAKGLEWRGVAVIGLEDAVVPSVYAVSDAQLEEERRLLYVALTRAEEELWCSWAAACTTQGREFVSGPSVFIECLERAVEQLRAPCDAESSRSKIGELRSLLATV